MQKERIIIYLAGALFALVLALTSYINSSFLGDYVGESSVGVVYIIASVLTILAMLFMDKILTRLGNRRASTFFSLLLFFSLIFLSVGTTKFIVLPAFVFYFLASNFIIANLDIFVEDFSVKSAIGRFRGFYLMVINSAWVVAQLISSSIINKSSFRGIYLLGALLMVLVALIFVLFLRNFRDPEYKKVPIIKTFEFFTESKNVSKIYLINLILRFFFAWMVIYTPIYLNQYMGFGWDQIGIIFTIMLLPFVILGFPLGKLSDKIGEKKPLAIGFLISAAFTLLIPVVTAPMLLVWAFLLFATRIGAATIEVMSEIYFFKSVPEEEAEETAFFRNTGPLSFILAPLVATPLLLILPSFEYLFFVLGAILLAGFWITLRLEDVR